MQSSVGSLTGSEARAEIREGHWPGPTAGLAPGYVQANFLALPLGHALDFVLFALRNPGPCPIVDVIDAGVTEPTRVAPGANLMTDVPRYRLFVDGVLADESASAEAWWREDLVTFLLGCSFSFDSLLRAAGIPLRHEDQGRNVPMYTTDLRCEDAGPYSAPLVVSMRPMSMAMAEQARRITVRVPEMHGAPVHIGDPAFIGIKDLSTPDFGDAVSVYEDEVPVFWACGVTTQLAVVHAKPKIAITHQPGHMFVTDLQIPNLD